MLENVRKAAACLGKHRFQSKTLALEVANRRRPGKGRYKVKVYRCAFCGCFHIGSTSR